MRGTTTGLRAVFAYALALALLCLLPCPTLAQKVSTTTPSLIVILLPGTSLADWQHADAPHLHALMTQGALAVMNTRTARTGSDKARETPSSALLTLGSGARAAGDDTQVRFVPPAQAVLPDGVAAGQLYTRRMGALPPPGAWVDTDWPRVLHANQGRGYDIRLGNLADGLQSCGVDMRAGGGASAPILACGGLGTVQVTGTLVLPPARAACIVWDAGPSLAAADSLVGEAMRREAQAGGRVLAVSPFASDRDYARGERLMPLALWGVGVAPGLLVSGSTRRAGLVTDTDFAPSVAEYFGATLRALPFGQAWTVCPAPNAIVQVRTLQAGAYRQGRGMRVLPVLAVLLGVYVLACSIALARGRGLRAMALAPLVGIAALLLSGSVEEWIGWLAVLGLAAVFLRRRRGAAWTVTALCALVAGTLTVDLLCGDPLMRRSLLGYSAVEGARYYGIGNEAMGVLVGAALGLAWRLWPAARARWARRALAAGLAGLAGLLALPAFGAKAGSVFVALPAFAVLLWTLSGRRITRRTILMLAVVAMCAMAGIVLLDRHAGGGQSHVGQASARIAQGGLGEAWSIITRKLGVEGHLLGHSAWAIALWGEVGSLVLLARAACPDARRSALWAAAGTAALTSLAFNDAGTVAGALCLAALWSVAAAERAL